MDTLFQFQGICTTYLAILKKTVKKTRTRSDIMETMKKLKAIIICISIMLLAASCASSDIPIEDLMKADGRTLQRKLPYLENLNRRDSGDNDIEIQSITYTIWERELRKNIMDSSTEKLGAIEIVELLRSESMNLCKTKRYIETMYEIRIYDNEGRVVWTNSYKEEAKYSLPLFGEKKNPEGEREAESTMLKSAIERFKKDIEMQYDGIKVKLR